MNWALLSVFKTRSRMDLAKWANDNFNLHDIDKGCDSEIAREIRNFNVRYSMYMESESDGRRVSTAISILAIIVSFFSMVVSVIALVFR